MCVVGVVHQRRDGSCPGAGRPNLPRRIGRPPSITPTPPPSASHRPPPAATPAPPRNGTRASAAQAADGSSTAASPSTAARASLRSRPSTKPAASSRNKQKIPCDHQLVITGDLRYPWRHADTLFELRAVRAPPVRLAQTNTGSSRHRYARTTHRFGAAPPSEDSNPRPFALSRTLSRPAARSRKLRGDVVAVGRGGD